MVQNAPVKGAKSRTAGLWKPTAIGLEFAYQRISVPKFKYVYNDTVFDTEGPDIGILDSIGEHFSYEELMNANYYGDVTFEDGTDS